MVLQFQKPEPVGPIAYGLTIIHRNRRVIADIGNGKCLVLFRDENEARHFRQNNAPELYSRYKVLPDVVLHDLCEVRDEVRYVLLDGRVTDLYELVGLPQMEGRVAA